MSDDTSVPYDIVILGGGSGGYATALRSAQLGLRVALIEKDKLGGTCLHSGCIPTKALLHAAEVADEARAGTFLGVRTSFNGVDGTALQAFKDRTITRLYGGLQGLIASSENITYVEGAGRLVGPKTVDVDGRRYTGTNLVLATGSVARSLPGIETGGRVLTSSEALALDDIPTSVVVIGGSVIGVEFASLWTSFSAQVTILEALPVLVPHEDRTLSKHLERAFRKRKIAVRTSTTVVGVEQHHDGVKVLLHDDEKLEADYVLVAVGRTPVSSGLGLEQIGVATDRGWVVTNERLATNIGGVYAVGDLVRGLQLAHRGFAHGIFVAEEIAGLNPEPVLDSMISRVTYCEPELASVGLTELQAREAFGEVDALEYNLGGNGKSQILQTTGVVKIVRQPGGPIVGIHMLGARMGEQIGEAALIVNSEATPSDIARIIHAHPTQNEALGEAALALAGKPLHTHR
ncbi:dihydrolipoyl dehydrogenase [Candidatus Protofrankia californiensis]|uniref:dihydrolipoyl dehydrogenase n=1 Tax=Candidatus Protofrankia californiensis TaxID=1839754 RepID=UPI0010416B45|nr:dihydrolipoyl dehydrogenase [Candidatus Protofrankia californiensis]